jgi:hypothetical protein
MHIRPWYREPLVWLIIAFPLTSVIAGFTTLYLAESTKDGLVVDDYYRKGKEINMLLARDQAAARAGLRGELQLDGARQRVTLDLQADRAELPALLTLRWLHATRAGFDRSQELHRGADGRFQAVFPELVPGHWYVQLEAQDWRLQGSLRVPDETRVQLVPVIPIAAPATAR